MRTSVPRVDTRPRGADDAIQGGTRTQVAHSPTLVANRRNVKNAVPELRVRNGVLVGGA